MTEWTLIEKNISLDQLLARWKGVKVDGNEIDFKTIDQFVRCGRLTAYDRKDWIVSGGHKEWRGQQRPSLLGLNGCEFFGQEDVIFNMEEIYCIEKEFASPPNVDLPKATIETASGPKMDGDKYIFAEHQLIKKEDLYRRWVGATDEEKAAHVNNGELSAYQHYKGPINGVLWCKPGSIYCYERQDYSNLGLYDYNDDYCDYFLLEDVERCEKLHPEYIGNVSVEGLGLPEDPFKDVPFTKSPPESNDASLPPAWLVALSANEVLNRLKITPVDLVDILNGVRICDDYNNYVDTKRLVTTDEEGFRAHTYNEPYFTGERLKSVKIYQVDFDRYCATWGIQKEAPTVTVDTSSLEAQLAEAQKKVEDVEGIRRWNKQFLMERAELQKILEEKNVRIAELENELASAPIRTNSEDREEGAWGDSATAICKAVFEVITMGRKDWVSGQEKGAGNTDSADKETFRALLKRMHPEGIRCRVKAESAAWKVLSDNGYTHPGGRKTNP